MSQSPDVSLEDYLEADGFTIRHADLSADIVAAGGGRIFVPGRYGAPASYLLSGKLDFNFSASGGTGAVNMRGMGHNSMINCVGSDSYIDCEGGILRMTDFRIYGDPTTPPKVGAVVSRAGSGSNKGAGINTTRLIGMEFNGHFQKFAFVNFCSEESLLLDCAIYNFKAGATGGVLYSNIDDIGLGKTMDTSSFTCSGHNIVGGGIGHYNGTGVEYPLMLHGTVTNFYTDGVWVNSDNAKAAVAIKAATTAGPSRADIPEEIYLGFIPEGTFRHKVLTIGYGTRIPKRVYLLKDARRWVGTISNEQN